jgi:hypothetical protein
MSLCLLSLLCVFFIAHPILAQQSGTTKLDGVPETCPVTKPYQTSLFVPPPPYPVKAGNGRFWFGTDRLWTSLPVNGMWKLLQDTNSAHPTFVEKVFWWRQGYDGRAEPRPKLIVRGKRIDSVAAPLEVSRPTTAIMERGSAMLVGVGFPTDGCWQIMGRYGDDELTFVAWVAR